MVTETTEGLRGDGSPASAIPNAAWAVASGSADALTAAFDPPVTSLTDGLFLGVRAAAANATTTPTFSPNNLPPFTITKKGGSPLVAGDIVGAGHEILLRLNLASARWEFLNPHTP